MNQDEAKIHHTIEQVERLYQVMRLQYNKMYSQNPENFRLFTEGTVEHIKRLIKELDDACGVTAALELPALGEVEQETLPPVRKTG